MKLTDPTDKKISFLHRRAQKRAKGAVEDALACGALLLKKHERVEHGGWGEYLVSVGIDDETARRYMICAHRRKLEGATDAKSLMDLYRSYGLLPALAGGGQRNGKEGNGGGQQLYFGYDLFSGFMRVLDARKGNPFLEVPREELTQTREQTVKALKLMDHALNAKGKIKKSKEVGK